MKTIPMTDRAKLVAAMNACFGVVKYLMGAKPRLKDKPGVGFTKSDCSGFSRWLLYQATGGLVTLPHGSACQWDWCKAQGLKLTTYDENAAGRLDSLLRIAFIRRQGNKAGHVLFVINGMTIECAGGKGVCRNPWSIYKGRVDACYVLTDVLT